MSTITDSKYPWNKTTLGSVGVQLQHGFTFPSEDLSTEGELPVIRIGNVQGGRVLVDENVRYSGSLSLEDLSKQIVVRGDVLMALTGGDESNLNTATGRVGRYGNNAPALLNQRVAKILPSAETDASFLFYFLQQQSITRHLAATANGSVQRNLTNGHVLDLEVPLPLPDEQHAIATVLSSLDDKIELLRKQNETLEEIAQVIFKEWFVNFNFPNEEGKPYRDSGGKMTDSELGEIPEGWRVVCASDIADVSIGRTPPRNEAEWFSTLPVGKKWISIKDMGSAGAYIGETSEYLTEAAIARFNIPRVPENTVIVSFKLTVGRIVITTEEMLSNEAIAHFVQKKPNNPPSEYIYLSLKSYNFNNLGSTSSIASATNSQAIKGIPFLLADEKIMGVFSKTVGIIFEKIKSNTSSIKNLSQTRDALLPKLMSGEVRVNM